MQILKKITEIFKSPLTLGILNTLLILAAAYAYYQYKGDPRASETPSIFFEVLTWIDQKSDDLRMNALGAHLPEKKQIAIIAVDDESLEEIGRWPWSRFEISRLIDHSMKAGAKVIGFDMIFSEPERTPGADQALAQTVGLYSDQLVMGAYFDKGQSEFQPYQEVCYHRAIQNFPYFQIVEKMTRPPLILEEKDYYEPLTKSLNTIFDPLLEGLADAASSDFMMTELSHKDPAEWSNQDKARTLRKGEEALRNYCRRWLVQGEDEGFEFYKDNWKGLIHDSFPEFVGKDFDESMRLFKSKALKNSIPTTDKWWVNIAEITRQSSHTAFFNADLDSDGTIRRKPLVYRAAGHYVPSLALQTYLVGTDSAAQIYIKNQQDFYGRTYKVIDEIQITNLEGEPRFKVPVDPQGRMRIKYAGPQKMFPHVRASDLLSDSEDIHISYRKKNEQTGELQLASKKVNRSEFMKDRLFIIGATATGVYDLRVTPFEEVYPGVETHANIVSNLLNQNFLRSYPKEAQWMLLTLAVLGLSLSFLLSSVGALAGLALTFLTFLAIYLIDVFFIYGQGYVVSIGFPLILTTATFISLSFFKYFTEERKKKYLRSTFSKYVSPAIVDEILKDPSNIELGGKKTRMTVFFSDVRGFTSISEKLDPVALSKLLSDYLTPMTDIVFANKGTLDKYMGDAIMAFFGAPIHFDDHANHACRCALQSLEKLKELQIEFEAQGLPRIDIGIGMNSAEMSVGNMGSDIVRNYTVMGDAVNLASRLEGINKQYGTRIIISEFTFGDIKESFTTREIDWVRVKGKDEPVKIYELVCEGQASGAQKQVLEHFTRGFKLYHEQQFSAAQMEFQAALVLNPEDEPSRLYVQRCQDYADLAPPTNWDGVFVMNSK